MSDYVLNNDVLAAVRLHSGISNMPDEAAELVWAQAEQAAKERGISIEFLAAELVRATYAKHVSEARRNGKAIDFKSYCREQLAGKEPIWSKLFAKKSKASAAVQEAAELESEITSTKDALLASENKVTELNNYIDAATSELSEHSDEAVQASIEDAARIWHLKGKSPFNESKVDSAIYHAAHAEVVTRVLSARLVQLRDSLAKENARVEAFKAELKRLEKSL